MKYLVLSDIHGNKYGLEAVLADAAGEYEAILCLGDVVGYGAHPNECCEILRAAGAHCLLGNHDAAAIGEISTEWFNPIAKAAIEWTTRQLSPENFAWLAALAPTGNFESEGFQAVHASLRRPLEEYITGPKTALPTIQLMWSPLCFIGHTHVAECYRATDHETDAGALEYADFLNGGYLPLEGGWRYLINPGSCGQPRDGNPQARYAIYDSAVREVDVHAVDYPWQEARAAILAAGLPPKLGDRLGQGQ